MSGVVVLLGRRVHKLSHSHLLQTFSEYQNLDNGDDDGVRPWLKGFVAEMGADTAAELLKGVGDVSVVT
jgi:hypothetical protein